MDGIVEYAALLNDQSTHVNFGVREKKYVYKKDSKWYIPNPVDPEDNYADSWTDETAKAFFEWVRDVKRDLSDTTCINEAQYLTGLQTSFGKSYVDSKLGLPVQSLAGIKPVEITQPSKPWGI